MVDIETDIEQESPVLSKVSQITDYSCPKVMIQNVVRI